MGEGGWVGVGEGGWGDSVGKSAWGRGGILRDAPEYECLYSRPSQAMYYKSLKMIMGVIFVVQVSVFGGSDRRIL